MSLTARAKDAAVSLLHQVHRSDTWQNTVTALGTVAASLSWHRPSAAVWLPEETLEAIYIDDGVGRRIVTEPVDAAFRQGWYLTPPGDMETDTAQAEEVDILALLDSVDAEANLKEALYWGRLYGRGGLLLGTDDGTADQSMPLDDASIKALLWVDPLTSKEFSAHSLYDDKRSPLFGQPETWNVIRTNATQTVDTHESRIILTRGIPTSKELRQENEWRDISVLQAAYEDLRNYNSAKTGMAQMLTDASQAVMWIRDLLSILADDQSVISTRMRIMEMARALHIMPLDAGDATGQGREDFQFVERTFTGVADTFDRLLGALSSSIGWPQTFLFGRSPAGENATGESDRAIWDDLVKAEQDEDYKPLLQRLVTIAAYVTGATDPEGWKVEFNPLRQETDAERVEREDKIADTDVKYIGAGVLDELTVAKHRFGGDEYNSQPVRLEEADVKAMEDLQQQDRERAEKMAEGFAKMQSNPSEPEEEPGDDEPEEDEE